MSILKDLFCCRNFLNKSFDKIREILEGNQDYSLTIIGYSLGRPSIAIVELLGTEYPVRKSLITGKL